MDSPSQQRNCMPKALLIDLENCPNHIKQLPKDLSEFRQVIICYANNSPRVPLEWIADLAGAVSNQQLRIEKMGTGGKNSADFGICFFAGMLMQSLPAETHFVIISDDTDLDHAIYLIKRHGRTAERIGKPSPKVSENSCGDMADSNVALQEYCCHLVKHKKTRPAKESTLLNSIKNKHKDSPNLGDQIFLELQKRGAIKVTSGKVSYHDTAIEKLSQSTY